MEFFWAIVALAGVLLFGTLQGIVVAIVVSLLGLASQTTHPPVYLVAQKRFTTILRPVSDRHTDDEIYEGLLIVRPEGSLFFINAHEITRQIGFLVKKHRPQVLVLDMSRVPDIEYSALKMLIEGEKRVTEHGACLWLTSLNPSVLDVVRRSGFAEQLGKQRMLFNASIAMDHYHQLYPDAAVISTQHLLAN
jgi:anti-anti-sigma factor